MKKPILFLGIIVSALACKTPQNISNSYHSPMVKQELIDDLTFKIDHYSTDKTYGYTKNNPVMVGGESEGPKNERRFLNALAGPNGEEISYYRVGSCCSFKTKNSSFGGGALDIYSISYEGLNESLTLYINMYDSDTLRVPVGLKLRE